MSETGSRRSATTRSLSPPTDDDDDDVKLGLLPGNGAKAKTTHDGQRSNTSHELKRPTQAEEALLVSSLPLGVALVIVCLIIVISAELRVFAGDVVLLFFSGLSTICILGIIAIFVLVAAGVVTLERTNKTSSVATAGILALGSGGMLHEGILLFTRVAIWDECPDLYLLVMTVTAFVLNGLQCYFLIKYSPYSLQGSMASVLIVRFFLIWLTATNACFWLFTIAKESTLEIQEEREHSELANAALHVLTSKAPQNHSGHHRSAVAANTPQPVVIEDQWEDPGLFDGFSHNMACPSVTHLEEIIIPYVYPLFIEFCVLAGSLNLAIWDSSKIRGVGGSKVSKKKKRHLPSQFYEVDDDQVTKYRHYSTRKGLFLGWFVVIATVGFVITALFKTHLGWVYNQTIADVLYGACMSLSVCGIIAIGMASYSLRSMVFQSQSSAEEEESKRDSNLLAFTALFVVAYKIMSIVAGCLQRQWLIMTEGFITITLCCMQYVFVSWYARHRRLAYPAQHALKPGRQSLEFLRWCNFACWLLNTFLMKTHAAKEPLAQTFGNLEWTILSSIVQPLTILYFFHAVMFNSDIISSIYVWVPSEDSDEEEPPIESADTFPVVRSNTPV